MRITHRQEEEERRSRERQERIERGVREGGKVRKNQKTA